MWSTWDEEQRGMERIPQVHLQDPDMGFKFKDRTRIMYK